MKYIPYDKKVLEFLTKLLDSNVSVDTKERAIKFFVCPRIEITGRPIDTIQLERMAK